MQVYIGGGLDIRAGRFLVEACDYIVFWEGFPSHGYPRDSYGCQTMAEVREDPTLPLLANCCFARGRSVPLSVAMFSLWVPSRKNPT